MSIKPIFFFALVLMLFTSIISAYAVKVPDISLDKQRTALLITDPQNDFLSKTGAVYGWWKII